MFKQIHVKKKKSVHRQNNSNAHTLIATFDRWVSITCSPKRRYTGRRNTKTKYWLCVCVCVLSVCVRACMYERVFSKTIFNLQKPKMDKFVKNLAVHCTKQKQMECQQKNKCTKDILKKKRSWWYKLTSHTHTHTNVNTTQCNRCSNKASSNICMAELFISSLTLFYHWCNVGNRKHDYETHYLPMYSVQGENKTKTPPDVQCPIYIYIYIIIIYANLVNTWMSTNPGSSSSSSKP